MSKSQVRSVTRPSTPSRAPIAWLEIRDVTFDAPAPWHTDVSLMQPMLESLSTAFPALDSLSVRNVRERRPTIVTSWPAAGDTMRESGSGVFELEITSDQNSAAMTTNMTDVSFTLDVQIPCSNATFGQKRGQLEELLQALHSRYCGLAKIGPSLSITPRHVPYTRPKPLREHRHWPAGAATLAACRHFFKSQGPERLARYELLQTRELPSTLNRRLSGDLLLLSTDAADGPELATQRSLLEKWIGESLQLPLDEDFNEHGDRRLTIWERQRAGELGFYDPASRMLYKAAPELSNDELDSGTLEELERVLRTRELPDERPVLGARIVFANRSAAVRWSVWASQRGGAAAYLDRRGDLWEPQTESVE